MEHLQEQHRYETGERQSWLPEYRLGHTILLVCLTGIVGWYAVYKILAWLIKLAG